VIQACHENGEMMNSIRLQKGQYIKASGDLGYWEGREKRYSKSILKRVVDKLAEKMLDFRGRIE